MKFKKIILVLSSIALIKMVNAAPNQESGIKNSKSGPISTKSIANPIRAQTKPTSIRLESAINSEDKVVLNFENADIQTVIKAISKLSGKNYVIDPRVKGTVNIVSDKPISKEDSYKVLSSALRMQGFATVEADGVIKVLPEADARTYGMKTDNKVRSPGDQLITKIFTIDSGSATQLANTLRPMISPNNSISVYPSSNSIVITDYSSNMARISKIVNDLKVTQASRLPAVTVRLKYAIAADVATTLQSYLGNSPTGGGGSSSMGDQGPQANIIVDPNSNSIIISSNVQSRINDLENLAQNLDHDAASNNSNLHVVYLKNADAAHVAEVLRVIASGQDNPDLSASPDSRQLSDTSSAFQSSSGSGGGSGSSFGSSGSSSSNRSFNRGSSSSSRGSQGNDKNAPKILIQAEPTTNALIIQAPEAVYRNFRMVISMLDVRRVEVMIEALIANINTTEQGNFGIQWIGGAGNNNLGAGMLTNYGGNGSSLSSIGTTAYAIKSGVSNSGGSGSPTGSISIPNEVYVGVVTGTVNIGGQTIPGISALADMLTANSAGNILGRPTLLTLDNEEASIFVGSNIGIPSGSYATTGGNSTVNPFTTVNRQDVGTLLRIKPLVTQSGAIQLAIYQEDSLLDPNQPTGIYSQNGPNIIKRNLKTQVLVNDGQMIALGGMTQDTVQLQSSGIPLLSSIPYLGWLFSWQFRQHVKQNLVIFLKPIIIRNNEGINALTNQRYRYIMGQQNLISAKGNVLLPSISPVTLDNQVPYDNKIPPQNNINTEIDLTHGANSATIAQKNKQTGKTRVWHSNGTTVIQNAPNKISITSDNPDNK